ncbi:MAG: hypothetical protein ACR2QV_00660 [Gammaproteobacteria bacterium]
MPPTPTKSPSPPRWGESLIAGAGAIAAIAVAVVVARAIGAGGAAADLTASPEQRRTDLCRFVDDAYLSGTLYGGLEREIEWRGDRMRCEGGPRPDGDGVRLVFAAPAAAAAGDRLVFVIGISGPLGSLTDAERPANVTIIDEATGRFFSSGQQDRCWTTVKSADGDGTRYFVAGEVYCAGSLPSLSDGSSVSLRGFRYAGRLDMEVS